MTILLMTMVKNRHCMIFIADVIIIVIIHINVIVFVNHVDGKRYYDTAVFNLLYIARSNCKLCPIKKARTKRKKLQKAGPNRE